MTADDDDGDGGVTCAGSFWDQSSFGLRREGGELVSFRYIEGEGFPFQERKDEFMIWANTSSERHRLLIISLCARMTSPWKLGLKDYRCCL